MTPVLETERLILRGWKLDDFPAFAKFWADPDRTRFFISGVQSEAQSWSAFTAMAGEWVLRGFGQFAIQLKSGSQAIGHAGIWYPPDIDEPEMAWSLYPGNDGHGYATEAARKALNWAHTHLGLPPLMSFVHPQNQPSIAVAKRLGATFEKETTLYGDPRLMFRHTHSQTTSH